MLPADLVSVLNDMYEIQLCYNFSIIYLIK